MSEIVSTARTAREALAQGLGVLQSDPNMPSEFLAAAEPIATAMGALHRIESTAGRENATAAPEALSAVRSALAMLQTYATRSTTMAKVLELIASSLGLIFSLTKMQPSAAAYPPSHQVRVAPAPTNQPVPPIAQPPAPIAHGSVPSPYASLPQTPIANKPAAPYAPNIPAPTKTQQRGCLTPSIQQLTNSPPSAAQSDIYFPSAQPVVNASSPQLHRPARSGWSESDPFSAHQPHPIHPQAPQPPALQPPALQPPALQPPALQQDHSFDGSIPLVEAELGTHSTTNFYKGLAGNDVVDHGGLFVSTYQIPRIGQNLRVHVALPGGYEFEAVGVVRWTREPRESLSSEVSLPGFGIQFTQITSEGRQLVYRYVRNREPLFHDDL